MSDRVYLGTLGGTSNAAGNVPQSPVVLQPIVYNGTTYVAGALGGRVFDIAQCFTRYRINRLLATYRPIVGTTTAGNAAVGFIDDPDNITPEGFPTTVLAVNELRCSHVDTIYRDIEVEWRNIQPSTWYFTDPASTATASGADIRLESPVSFIGGLGFTAPSTSITAGGIYLYYDITFEGAEDPSGSVQ